MVNKKIILTSIFLILSTNSLANETIKENIEVVKNNSLVKNEVFFNKQKNKKNTLTLDEIFKKYGDSKEAMDYINRNELYYLLEERNKLMQ